MTRPFAAFALIIVIAVAFSCAAPEPPPPPEPTRIENTDLSVILGGLPDSLVVATNEGTILELVPADELTEGSLTFEVGPRQVGINLVAAVQEHQAAIEAMPEGQYQGAQELSADFGVAFYSRGRFLADGATTEETIIVLIHPTGDRMLTLRYRYPAASDSAKRVEELIEVLSYLE